MSAGEVWLLACLATSLLLLGFLAGLGFATWRFGRWLIEGAECEPCPACQPEGDA